MRRAVQKIKDADTSADRLIKKTKNTGYGTSGPDDLKSICLLVMAVKQSRGEKTEGLSIFFSNARTEKKMKTKTKRAAIIMKKIFDSNSVPISEEKIALHIDDEPKGMKVTICYTI